MSRQGDDQRRLVVRAIIAAFIEHPDWRDTQIARETGFDADLVAEVRAFALSFPPTDGVKAEPDEEEAPKPK